MITKELTQNLMERLIADSLKETDLRFELKPIEAYLLVSLVQLAISHSDIPENPLNFGTAFIKSFCDRYREELPAMVESFELADQENFLMTREEFDDLTNDDYEDDFI